jgi:DNA uptake protein ComE-like DNA-binding protein
VITAIRRAHRGGVTARACIVVLIAARIAPAATADENTAEADRQAVQQVCGRCHTVNVFLNKPRAWARWNDVFADMTQRGATGTDEQLTRVTRFFLENLTLVNVNSSPADELKWVLGVRDDVMQAIIARREHQPFRNLEELRAVPGVDALVVDQRTSRISF